MYIKDSLANYYRRIQNTKYSSELVGLYCEICNTTDEDHRSHRDPNNKDDVFIEIETLAPYMDPDISVSEMKYGLIDLTDDPYVCQNTLNLKYKCKKSCCTGPAPAQRNDPPQPEQDTNNSTDHKPLENSQENEEVVQDNTRLETSDSDDDLYTTTRTTQTRTVQEDDTSHQENSFTSEEGISSSEPDTPIVSDSDHSNNSDSPDDFFQITASEIEKIEEEEEQEKQEQEQHPQNTSSNDLIEISSSQFEENIQQNTSSDDLMEISASQFQTNVRNAIFGESDLKPLESFQDDGNQNDDINDIDEDMNSLQNNGSDRYEGTAETEAPNPSPNNSDAEYDSYDYTEYPTPNLDPRRRDWGWGSPDDFDWDPAPLPYPTPDHDSPDEMDQAPIAGSGHFDGNGDGNDDEEDAEDQLPQL